MIHKFNLSASALNTWFSSELEFFYSYMKREKADTEVVEVYGKGGNCVHNALEEYAKGMPESEVYEFFKKEWAKGNLYVDGGFNGKPLSYDDYFNALKRGMQLLQTTYNGLDFEMEILKPLALGFNIKGYIDVIAEIDGAKVILDYKTSSSVDSGDSFKRQALMYCYLYYRETNHIINEAHFEYLKIGKHKKYTFTNDEVINFGNFLKETLNDILSRGDDPENYDLGEWKNPFNQHRQKCFAEYKKRQQSNTIRCMRKNNQLIFLSGLTDTLVKLIDTHFSYMIKGAEWSDKFKSGFWDGKQKFMRKDKRNKDLYAIPYPFMHQLNRLLLAYNTQFETNYHLKINDTRIDSVTKQKWNTQFRESDKTLRPYQEEAIQTMLAKKNMILYGGTGYGKTFTSAEFIRRTNARTLFVVNRIELVRQTADELKESLGVDVGIMAEGQLDTAKQITVASIQTLYAILKRDNAETKVLRTYLFNVNNVIFDEAQNVSDSGMYGTISISLTNAEYVIGLSGSPWRNENDTLMLNSLCGFIEYSKTTKQLEDEGWLVPTKCSFLENFCEDSPVSGEYHEDYRNHIVNNKIRNQKVVKIVEGHVKDNDKILVLVKSLDHGKLLQTMIPNSFFLNGSTGKKERKEVVAKFKNTKEIVLISMLKIIGIGFDCPDLDAMINASGHKSDTDTVQVVGRLKRKFEGKVRGYYYDFYDLDVFQDASDQRIMMLQKFGNEVEIVGSDGKVMGVNNG